MKKHSILVSGGSGFVGKHLCDYLRKNGVDIIDGGNSTKDSRSAIDVTDLSQLLSIGDDVEAVIHLAAKTSVNDSFFSPRDTYYTNLVGTLNLLELARKKKIPKFLNISTYVYGQPQYSPVDERHPVDPRSPYNRSKLLAEQLCQSYSDDFDMDIVSLRPFYLYGSIPRPNSFIYCVLEQIIKKNGNVILSGESTRRDFLFIDDFINLIEVILNNFPVGYNLYNVGYGKSHLLTDVCRILAKLLKKKIHFNYDNQMRPGDITDMVADVTKVSTEFNWKPTTSLKQGLGRTVEEYTNAHRHKYGSLLQ
ncbi:MAG: NAD-dependent epimerase/dehydratase family protein [Nitrososphaeraceae archaeon]|nr:NAD-dependent epimerase/dehydratase family protein [Nitrososphaeraceae archaeon]